MRPPLRATFGRATALRLGVCCAMVGVALPLASQSPADRNMLEAWRDSLDHATTVAMLEPLDRPSRVGAKGDVADLRRELFRLRSAELKGARPAFELTLSNLDWLANRERKWPWPDYLMARAFVAMAKAKMPVNISSGQLPHEQFTDAVWRHLQAAVQIDPEFLVGRRYLFGLMVAGGERELRPEQLALLRNELQQPAPVSDALLVFGRDQRRHRHYDEALQAFELSARAGGDSSRLALELARTFRALGDTARATNDYWLGVQHPTAVGREEYRHDLAWILEPDSLALFDRVADDALVPWLNLFWARRDAEAAAKPGERLLSQLMRYSYAFGRYAALEPWKRTMYSTVPLGFESGLGPLDWSSLKDRNPVCGQSSVPDFFKKLWQMPPLAADDIRTREPILDQRGLLYLHHGEPIRRFASGKILPSDTALYFAGNDPWRDSEVLASRAGRGGTAPETWLYLIDGAYRSVGFRGSAALGTYAATTLGSYLKYDPRQWVVFADYIPIYTTGAIEIEALPASERRMPGGSDATPCLHQVQAGLNRGRVDSKLIIGTETKSPPIVRPWTSAVQLFALGREQEHDGQALITIAMGGRNLLSDAQSATGGDYTIDFHIVAFEHSTGRTVSLDSTRHFHSAAPLSPGQSLTANFGMPLSAGHWQVAVRANQGADSSGLYALTHDLVIPDSKAITMSDVVAGVAGAPAWLATDGQEFPVNYFGSWRPGSTAELYFEVHGVGDGEPYRTTLNIRSTDPKVKETLQIASTDRASGAITYVRKALGLERLPPGSYQLTVTVEAGNQKMSRVRPITIVKP